MERRSGIDRRRMNGPQKAAVLLLAMGKDAATRLLKHFDPSEIKEITRAAASLGVVEQNALEGLIEEFALGLAAGPQLIGDLGGAEQLLSAAMGPEEAAQIMGDLSGPQKVNGWKALAESPESRIMNYVMCENRQITALLLARIDAELAARVLSLAEPNIRNEIIGRMLSARPAPQAIVDVVEDAVGQMLASAVGETQDNKAPARIANIVNRMEPADIDRALESLATALPAEVDAVRALIFKFDDVILMSQPARSALFDQVPTERVVLALKGVDDALKAAVLASLGARARRMVESELSSDDTAPAREVTKARRMIADLALKLAEAGTIVLPSAVKPADPASEPT